MSATIVVDALWGDSGKGKIASYLAERDGAKMCVRAGTGTNAGHSIYLSQKEILKTNQLPLAGILSGAQLRVGSGVAVDPSLFLKEVREYGKYGLEQRARVDMRCPVILPEYIERERRSLHLSRMVGSTMSGTGMAQAEYCLRTARQAKDIDELQPYLADVPRELYDVCHNGGTVIVEGSQGTLLSLSLTGDYPFCTSGNCTTAAFVDDVGLNWKHIGEVVLIVKAVPSRVGEGPLPFEIAQEEQDRRGIAEYGVRTGRRRRKSESIPMDLLKESVMLNGPTQIALTFCDHFDPEVKDKRRPTDKLKELIESIEDAAEVPVTMIDTGKLYGSVIELAR